MAFPSLNACFYWLVDRLLVGDSLVDRLVKTVSMMKHLQVAPVFGASFQPCHFPWARPQQFAETIAAKMSEVCPWVCDKLMKSAHDDEVSAERPSFWGSTRIT